MIEKDVYKIAGRKSKEAWLHYTTGKESKQEYRKGRRATSEIKTKQRKILLWKQKLNKEIQYRNIC